MSIEAGSSVVGLSVCLGLGVVYRRLEWNYPLRRVLSIALILLKVLQCRVEVDFLIRAFEAGKSLSQITNPVTSSHDPIIQCPLHHWQQKPEGFSCPPPHHRRSKA